MTMQVKLPEPVLTYVSAINSQDATALQSTFADDALVTDVGREIRGIVAIMDWANREIFGVNVNLEIMKSAEHGAETILTVKVDGTFDRTGLPDPLLMDQCFTIANEKIVSLTCRFAGE